MVAHEQEMIVRPQRLSTNHGIIAAEACVIIISDCFLLFLPELMKIQIPAFDKARVLVVGDVMLDRYWHGATS